MPLQILNLRLVAHHNLLCNGTSDQFVFLSERTWDGVGEVEAVRFTVLHVENIEFKKFGIRDNVAQLCVLKVCKTYRLRVSNVGISTSWNFRIQGHNLLLAETEGSYTVKQNYTSLDIHVGKTYSFFLSTDQNASTDYYIVASARFVNESLWRRVIGVGILRYSNSKGKASGPLPEAPQDQFDKTFSMNQASGARPNPQGSFKYGSINVTDIYVLRNKPPVTIDGKRRTTLNGISFVNPHTPIRLSDQYKVKNVYKADFPTRPITGPPKMEEKYIP
ncbi:hypothetical protein POM88_006341 [Heracleum sosnowskyi]|uniref:Plastocyanin-like domain-containing protein n=1 Tax=Heracleum sosnowskyi TaxID=360622 RepID=A0AAD8J4P3_9APIA|nr:hypothetical protein POM88_006341 [Heracleum sosnowskyi]